LGEYLDQPDHFGPTEATHLPGYLQPVDPVPKARRRKFGRNCQQQRLDHLRHPLEMGLVGGVALGVLRGELRQFGECLLLVLPEQEVAVIGKRREEGGVFGINGIPMRRKIEVADDTLLQQARQISGGGDAVTGPDLLGDRASTDHLALFQYEHAAAGTRQVRGGYQAVVAAADDDDIVSFGHSAQL
jgi:hypothetical protein